MNGGNSSWQEARDSGSIGRPLLSLLEPLARLDGGLELVDVSTRPNPRSKSQIQMRAAIARFCPHPPCHPQWRLQVHTSQDGTQKLVLAPEALGGQAASSGSRIEAVVIPMGPEGDRRGTLCVSSQVGCAMNCKVGCRPTLV